MSARRLSILVWRRRFVSERSSSASWPAGAGAAGSSASALATALSTCRGRSGRTSRAAARPAWIRREVSSGRRPERVLAGERLPEHHADRPDVGSRASPSRRAAARARCTRACRECRRAPVSVSNSAIWASPKSSSRTSIAPRLGEQYVRRLDVAWTIPRRWACASASAICAATSTAPRVVELSAADRLAQRAAGDVLVRDVDVRRVAGQRDDPLAARMPQRGCCARLALGPMPRLPFPRDDLQGDVEAAPLVAGQPDVTHPARAERSQRAVPAEDELLGERRRGHPRELLPRRGKPFSDRLSR